MSSGREEKNIYWHNGHVTKGDRNGLNRHGSGLIWFTGLSASGKSTIAHSLEKVLFENGIRAYVLDGDNVRHGLNSDLEFSIEDRNENIRRVVEVAKLFIDAGIIVLAAFITPLKEERQMVKERLGGDTLIEVYVKCSIEECIKRDPKGLYRKAQMGIIKNYTGISSPYEEPEDPHIIVDTQMLSKEEAVLKIFNHIQKMKLI